MWGVARSGQALSTLLSNVPVRIAVAVVVAQQILLGQLLVLRNLQGLVHVRQEVLRDLWRELQETLWGWGCEEVVGSARQQALTRSRRVGAGEVQGQSSSPQGRCTPGSAAAASGGQGPRPASRLPWQSSGSRLGFARRGLSLFPLFWEKAKRTRNFVHFRTCSMPSISPVRITAPGGLQRAKDGERERERERER